MSGSSVLLGLPGRWVVGQTHGRASLGYPGLPPLLHSYFVNSHVSSRIMGTGGPEVPLTALGAMVEHASAVATWRIALAGAAVRARQHMFRDAGSRGGVITSMSLAS